MPELKIDPVLPIPADGQPALIVEYTCLRCGMACRRELAKPGFLPRYCDDCLPLLNTERVQRWRKRHPDQAKAAAKKQNDKRPRKGQAQTAKTKAKANAASSPSQSKPADLTDEEWQTLRQAVSYIGESGGSCYLGGLIREQSAAGVVMVFPYRSLIESLVEKNYLTVVKDKRFRNASNPQGIAQVLADKARAALGMGVAVEPGSQVAFDWWMRDALRQAAERGTIRRDRRTKRGVQALVKLGLLRLVKQTETSAVYGITDLGQQVMPQLPTADDEWEATGTDKYRDFTVVIPPALHS